MKEHEFRDAVHSGLGRAIIYAREHDIGAFRDIVLDACLHCYSVDCQSEGTRASFMFELVNLTPEPEFYARQVLSALSACGEDWETVQRFCFASYLAIDGDRQAKQAIYESLHPGPKFGEEICINVVQMDGLDGLVVAAERMGALLIANRSEVDEGHLFYFAIKTFGEERTVEVLRNAGKINPNVEAYRLAAQSNRANSGKTLTNWREVEKLQYEELKQKSLGGLWLAKWGEQASRGNLEQAARDLMNAQAREEQLFGLQIFGRTPFPLDHAILLQLAVSMDERVAEVAATALANVTHPLVRDLAFQLVETKGAGRQKAISILGQNFESGDHQIVLQWFEHEEDRQVQHGMGMALRSFWKRHPQPASEVQMLLALYEKGPCSWCRESLLRRLLELDAVTDSMRTECAYDANDDVRGLFIPD